MRVPTFSWGANASASPKVDVDVIIVGAGFSGLAAARKLVGAGLSVLVLEALDRVGGKVYDKPLISGGDVVEVGAEFIGPCQDRIAALIAELGIETFPTYHVGKTVSFIEGQRTVYDPAVAGFPMEAAGLVQMGEATATLDAMAETLDPRTPWTHPCADAWDSMTLATWFDQHVPHQKARALLDLTTRTLVSAEPADVSLLQFLTYICRAGNESNPGTLRRLCSVEGGSQQTRCVGGPQAIAVNMAKALGSRGRVQLKAPVRAIRRLTSSTTSQVPPIYQVSADPGLKVTAHHVVVALSPPLASRILYDPPLPPARDQLSQHMPMGSLGKVIAIYKTPFWREDGLSGSALGLDGVTVQATFDSSPEDGSKGVLLGFCVANAMRHWDRMTEEEIQTAVVEDYVHYFGPRARDVEHWVIQRWDHEEYAKGGHFAVCPPNVLTVYGPAITEPVGNIFFAGTEASPYWSGFMEGALQAGEIAAERILALSSTAPSEALSTASSPQRARI